MEGSIKGSVLMMVALRQVLTYKIPSKKTRVIARFAPIGKPRQSPKNEQCRTLASAFRLQIASCLAMTTIYSDSAFR